MTLPPEVIMLIVYALAVSMIVLAMAIDSRRIHKKLDRIILLLIRATKTSIQNDDHISNSENNRQHMFPDSSHLAIPNEVSQDGTNKNNNNNNDYRTSSHRGIVKGNYPVTYSRRLK